MSYIIKSGSQPFSARVPPSRKKQTRVICIRLLWPFYRVNFKFRRTPKDLSRTPGGTRLGTTAIKHTRKKKCQKTAFFAAGSFSFTFALIIKIIIGCFMLPHTKEDLLQKVLLKAQKATFYNLFKSHVKVFTVDENTLIMINMNTANSIRGLQFSGQLHVAGHFFSNYICNTAECS